MGTEALFNTYKPLGQIQVYHIWDNVQSDSNNLAVYESTPRPVQAHIITFH